MKVRESRVGADIVFAVDASGSMGAARRMKEVKEAVLSMLMDSYQKRDQVGLVAFRGGEAAAVLELTRQRGAGPAGAPGPPHRRADPAGRWAGGGPPHAGAAAPPGAGFPAPAGAHHRRPGQFQPGGDPVEEALRAARRVAEAHIPAVVIDTERQFVSLGLAAQVAQVMGAPCYRVEELRARPLAQLVRGHSPAAG